jgi:hypothetical protein
MLMERQGLSVDTAAERIQQIATTECLTLDQVTPRLLRERSSGQRRRSGR